LDEATVVLKDFARERLGQIVGTLTGGIDLLNQAFAVRSVGLFGISGYD
jgi:hypothetical protein